MTQEDVNDGLGLPFAAAKFLCYPKETPTKKAFIRIYLQIPVAGTQYESRQIRQEQAAKPQPHVELTTLKALKEFECDVVPNLLAYQEGKQSEESIVPGEPLNAEEFWEQDFKSRQAIRNKFRKPFRKFTVLSA